MVKNGLKTSAPMGLTAAAIAILVGVILGSLAAYKHNTWVDRLIMVISTSFVAVPSFIISTILLYLCCVKWRILPANGGDIKGYILPTITLRFMYYYSRRPCYYGINYFLNCLSYFHGFG